MKNKKFKLFASLTSLVMVVAVMAVGVWAAQTTTVGITGNVGFTAGANVIANVSAAITADETLGNGVVVTNGTPAAVSFNGDATANQGIAFDGLTITAGDTTDLTKAAKLIMTITVNNVNPGYQLKANITAATGFEKVTTTEQVTSAGNQTLKLTLEYTTPVLTVGVDTDFSITVTLTAGDAIV